MKAVIIVTAADLDRAIAAIEAIPEGEPGRTGCCLLAQAMTRVIGKSVSVGHDCAFIQDCEPGEGFELPDDAKELVSLFDQERYGHIRTMLPVEFTAVGGPREVPF